MSADDILAKEDRQPHIFSDQHKKDGIMEFGDSERDIVNKLLRIIHDVDGAGFSKEGFNVVQTTISGKDAQINFFIKNGELLSIDGIPGHSTRSAKNAIGHPGLP
ncbi:hypothetical protein IC619_002820 [Hazenella sp. IB182353]|uniref:polymorphic toxin type 35 domain-containing protein n=1 Tax=Polycladospora coralii TaxID=2771432 RepID=UPI00174784FB|nr:polymorphic toxin type 35 domain-containing protein [Polycladospora coralii]MBS7529430.1 hypothetical protein [Polycladospora coralii]